MKEVYDKTKELKKETTTLNNEYIKSKKDFCIEKIEIFKFITEQELKNVDVILDILKLTTSLSISIFVASLTTTYFSKEIYIIIYINIVLIVLLVMFIVARNKVLLRSKTTILDVLKESDIIMCDDIILKCTNIKEELKKLKEQRSLIKDLKK